ncbi:MAG TPA: TadE/TadG family type IV pilus assembly protein [Mycoplana sp.]|jgi:Flp pilus assembly protein TadG|nr:TadE/TadG family type IV pilus assembly protein [Mycoplana sp.]
MRTVKDRKHRHWFRRVLRERSGAAALEFAILAPMFFLIVFATVETFVAYTAEQMLINANDTMARRVRMGEITFNMGRPTDMNEAQFRAAFCAELTVLLSCSSTEATRPSRLFLDVRSANSFSTLPANSVPRIGDSKTGPLDTSAFRFSPGGKSSINIVRAYYSWPIILDYIRPVLANLPSADGSLKDYLMVATNVIQSEEFK